MNRLTETFNFILTREEEINRDLKRNSSKIINRILKENYPTIDGKCNSTKKCLLLVWNMIVDKASRKYSRSWQKMFEALDKVLNLVYSNENTRESTLTEFRKPLRDKKFDPLIYTKSTHIIGVSRERALERREEYANRVTARNADRGNLVPVYVHQIVEVIQKLLPSADAYEQTVAVLLATGSRSIEVFKLSQYTASPNHNQVVIRGLAKDKGQNNLKSVVLIRNIVGALGSQVVTAVKEIREKLGTESLTNNQVSDKHNKILNRVFKKHIHPLFKANAGDKLNSEQFKRQLKGLTSHKARYIGGNASYQIYGRPKNIPETSYLQGQYGHLSSESTKSYLAVQVRSRSQINSSSQLNEEVKEMLKSQDKENKKLKEKVDQCCSPTASINEAGVDLNDLVNTRKKGIPQEDKVKKFLEAIRRLKRANVNFKQKELMAKLKYSATVAGLAYKQARVENLI